MGNKLITATFDRSQARGVSLLVLLALADRADDTTRETWCSTVDIARRCRVQRNHVVRHTSKLVELGELELIQRVGMTHLYRILIPAKDIPKRDTSHHGTPPTTGLNTSHLGTEPVPPWDINPQEPPRTQNDIAQSASSATSTTKPDGFQEFWEAYPRKVGKTAAQRAWEKSAKTRPPLADVLSAIERAKASRQWTDRNGQFIPHPATWINRGGWDDRHEPETAPKPRMVL